MSVFEPRIASNSSPVNAILVVAKAKRIEGRVVAEGGQHLHSAHVAVELPGTYGRGIADNRLRSAFPLDIASHNTAEWASTTDAFGWFSIPNVPDISGVQIVTSLEGYQTQKQNLLPTQGALLITLKPLGAHSTIITGRVVDPRGQGVEHAYVCLGTRLAITNDDGEFELNAEEFANDNLITAFSESWLPVCQSRILGLWPTPLVIKFDRESLTIGGRVVDANEKPIGHCKIRIIDPVRVGEVLAYCNAQATVGTDGLRRILGGREVLSASDGTFTIRGLLPRSYLLLAQEAGTLLSSSIIPLAAGAVNVEVRIPQGDTRDCVSGRLHMPGGAGARLDCAGPIQRNVDGYSLMA